jgi:hypothetical protein
MSVSNAEKEVLHACITNVSFPATVRYLEEMIKKNRYLRERATDIDTLLEFEPGDDLGWTAPRWMTEGDILFFYHTASARGCVAKVRGEVDRSSTKFDHLKPVLDNAEAHVDQYSQTIFGCALVSGTSHREDDPENRKFFRNRIFAPLGEVCIFEHPLSHQVFRNVITLSPGGTLTPIYGRQFTALKKLLAQENELPEFLQQAVPGTTGFSAVKKNNWMTISCAPTLRFIDESQLRVYLLDYFLAELKDKGTPLLEECNCYRGGTRTGVSDYFVSLHGIWLPVEAKLNLATERDLKGQVNKYVHLDSFTPTKGRHQGECFEPQDIPFCLVIDQQGIFLMSDGTYVGCEPAKPIWCREELGTRGIIQKIRSHLADLLSRKE